MKETNDAEIDQEVASSRFVLLDVYAPWCGPCRAMQPMLEEFDRTHPNVLVLKINGDENPVTMQRHRVRGYPTLVFFRDGQPAGTYTGNPGSLAGLEQLLV